MELLLRQIPEGMFSTYDAIAIALGDIIARDAVREFAGIKAGGKVIPGIEDGIMLFDKFETEFPLKKLRNEQIMMSKRVVTEDDFEKIERIAGMDVAYKGNTAYGAYVEMDMKGNVIEKNTETMEVNFPYIPTYFSYRELPVLEKLLEGRHPDIVMVNGSGVAHPRHFGMASHLGVLHSLPVIGITKRLLCGEVRGKYIYMGKEKVGAVYGKNPIYISPGHKISVDSSVAISKELCRYRIPEPLMQAHVLATETKNENNL